MSHPADSLDIQLVHDEKCHVNGYRKHFSTSQCCLHRYTPSLSRRCTHLVVSHDADVASSKKLALALHNKPKWGTHIVSLEWISSCCQSSARLPETEFAFPLRQEDAPNQQSSTCHAAETAFRSGQPAAYHASSPFDAASATPQVHPLPYKTSCSLVASLHPVNGACRDLILSWSVSKLNFKIF